MKKYRQNKTPNVSTSKSLQFRHKDKKHQLPVLIWNRSDNGTVWGYLTGNPAACILGFVLLGFVFFFCFVLKSTKELAVQWDTWKLIGSSSQTWSTTQEKETRQLFEDLANWGNNLGLIGWSKPSILKTNRWQQKTSCINIMISEATALIKSIGESNVHQSWKRGHCNNWEIH